jgi:hypothetical protein
MNQIFSTTSILFSDLQRELEKFRVHPGFNGFQFGNAALVIVAFAVALSGMSLVFRRCFGRY